MRRPALPAEGLLSAHRRAAALAALLLALGACSPAAAPVHRVVVGEAAPAFGAETLDGERVELAGLRGQVVLLNVWATWCPPCREEMPGLQALHEELGPEGLHVVAASVDESGAGEQVRAFTREHGITFTVLHDRDQEAIHRFQPRGIPETFLIGRDGRLLRRWIGRIEPGAPSVRSAIRGAL